MYMTYSGCSRPVPVIVTSVSPVFSTDVTTGPTGFSGEIEFAISKDTSGENGSLGFTIWTYFTSSQVSPCELALGTDATFNVIRLSPWSYQLAFPKMANLFCASFIINTALVLVDLDSPAPKMKMEVSSSYTLVITGSAPLAENGGNPVAGSRLEFSHSASVACSGAPDWRTTARIVPVGIYSEESSITESSQVWTVTPLPELVSSAPVVPGLAAYKLPFVCPVKNLSAESKPEPTSLNVFEEGEVKETKVGLGAEAEKSNTGEIEDSRPPRYRAI